MGVTPLSHHDILTYVGPFSRAGRQVDLALTQRDERLIAFKRVDRSVDLEPAGSIALTEHLTLSLAKATPQLTRTLETADGLRVTLTARDANMDKLLERILAVSPNTHFRLVEGLLIGDSLRCPDDASEPPVLRESRVNIGPAHLHLDARTVGSEPMTVRLTCRDREADFAPPDDLLAVLGRYWSVLETRDEYYKFTLNVPGRQPKRSRVARTRFERTAAHLQHVFTLRPEQYHETFRAERWKVWRRRLIPLGVIVAMLGALPFLGGGVLAGEKGFTPLAISLPNILFVLFMYVSRHEIPTIGVPPFPQPLDTAAWTPASGKPGTEQTRHESISHG